MIAVEINAPIINHRIEFSSEQLPQNLSRAKIIVMYEEPELSSPAQEPERLPDILALARSARASFPKGDSKQLNDEFNAIRSEWDQRGYEK